MHVNVFPNSRKVSAVKMSYCCKRGRPDSHALTRAHEFDNLQVLLSSFICKDKQNQQTSHNLVLERPFISFFFRGKCGEGLLVE